MYASSILNLIAFDIIGSERRAMILATEEAGSKGRAEVSMLWRLAVV